MILSHGELNKHWKLWDKPAHVQKSKEGNGGGKGDHKQGKGGGKGKN